MLPIVRLRVLRRARDLANIKDIEERKLFIKFENIADLMLEESFKLTHIVKLRDCLPVFPEKFFLALHDAYMER
jgi:hypothetical protein